MERRKVRFPVITTSASALSEMSEITHRDELAEYIKNDEAFGDYLESDIENLAMKGQLIINDYVGDESIIIQNADGQFVTIGKKGEVGPQGEAGAQGVTGPTGPIGPTGV